jgi:hypothetical protein
MKQMLRHLKTDKFLSETIASFHRMKPAGQTELFAARTGKDQFVVLEQYVPSGQWIPAPDTRPKIIV